ncbi:MAG: hypothetical protein LC799_16190, partial [Actinobacteria bacterium]|nr:hypothetical protein [Actinomycetota bacterium]
MPAKELARLGRVSRRAMKTIVNAATRLDMVAVDEGEVSLLVSLPPIEAASCPPLEALVTQLELEHPHFPVPYGTADPSFTGGPGIDWKPVRRRSQSSVGDLPMTALLSQAIVAFAIEYESGGGGPIQWAANILQTLDDDGVGLPPLPERGTHSVSNLVRLGILALDQDAVLPTARGRVLRDAYRPLCEQIESRWRHQFGSSLVDEVIDAVGVFGDWRPFPLVAWTGSEFSLLA